MLIDWFTVVAQLLNFAVLVFLLKHFLYKPVLRAIDAREALVAEKLAAAETKRLEAEAGAAGFQQRNAEFDGHRAGLFQQAAQDAAAEREKLIAAETVASQARDAERIRAGEEEAQRLRHSLGVKVRAEVFALSRKVLADVAGVSLEERIVEVLVARLGEGTKVLLGSGAPVTVATALGLAPDQEATVVAALKKALGADTEVVFVLKPELVSGVELTAQGFRVSWGLADEMAGLEALVP